MLKIGIILMLTTYPGIAQINQGEKGTNQFGSPCSDGGLWYDDGSYEGPYTYPVSNTELTYVQRFAPPVLPYQVHEVCVRLSAGVVDDLTGTIVLFADTGSGPGTLLYQIPFTAIDIPGGSGDTYSYDISSSNAVVGGSFYLGVRWTTPPNPSDNFWILGDESITTPFNPGYRQYSGGPWQAITVDFSGYRALGVRLAGAAPVDVPALGPWGLVGLVAVLMIGGLFLLRRRQQTT